MASKSWLRWLSPSVLTQQASLSLRLIALTGGLFVTFIWILVIVSAMVLESRLEQLLANQQLSATAQLATTLNQKLDDNLAGLRLAAAGLPPDLSYEMLQPLLAQRPLMHVAFSAGLMVVGLDGMRLASYPGQGNRDAYYGDRDWFRHVVATGESYVGKPVIGRTLMRPVFSLAVPVFDAAGRVRAVLIGGIDLTAPSFLGFVSDPAQVGNNEFFVVSPRDNLIIAATDPKRAMTPLPERGRSAIYDQMVDGLVGSVISTSTAGIRKLYSTQRVPTANWLILAGLPTDIAFGPVRTMQNYLYAFAALLTLLAMFAIRFMVQRVVAPLTDAAQAIGQMTAKQTELAPLPVRRNDEVGALIRNFNHLVVLRLEYEAALAESEQRFRMLVEGAPDAIFVQTRGCFAYVNAATVALFGATGADELLHKPVLDRIHPDFRVAIATRIRRINEERQSNPAMEQEYLRIDGTTVAVETLAVPIQYGDDNGALVFARDISDKKRSARELDLYRNHLEELVAERTTQLAAAKQAAEAATRAKSQFLATMSHEIRTPLGIIVGLGNILRQKLRDPAQAKRLAQLCDTADHLSGVINDILDLSKIDAGHLALDEGDFRLAAVLDKVTNLVGELARERALTLTLEVPPELRDVRLRGDALRLAQVLINLTGNAVKFTEQGSIFLGVTAVDQTVAGLRLRFAVRDTGIGIAPDDQARIFCEFEQGSAATAERNGTGLGLAISQKLVTLMGGSIHLESVPGSGSTFSFELTLARGSDAAEIAVSAAPPDFGGARVLVAEDHPVNQEIILDLLESFGCEAEFAGDGVEAIECARTAAYDLILMDVRMPRMDGPTATRAIRELPQHRGTPILALTASAFSEDRQRCLDAGMNGYISKPFTPITMAAGLKPWLRNLAAADGGGAGAAAVDQALAAIPGLDAACLFRSTASHPTGYVSLLRRYVDFHEGDMERLQEHMTAGDREAARGIVHQLKGVSAFVGTQRIAVCATEIEAALRAGAGFDAVAPLAASCAAELATLAAAVRKMPEEVAG